VTLEAADTEREIDGVDAVRVGVAMSCVFEPTNPAVAPAYTICTSTVPVRPMNALAAMVQVREVPDGAETKVQGCVVAPTRAVMDV
jgi:hypothetical protein